MSSEPTLPPEYVARFWSNVDKSGSCWLWTGRLNDTGYGVFFTGKRDYVSHRVSFWALRGPFALEMMIDHICRVRRCVNPDHLRVATSRENTLAGVGASAINARKTHCIRGHRLDGENVQMRKRPGKPPERRCLACRRRKEPCPICGSMLTGEHHPRHFREVHAKEADR